LLTWLASLDLGPFKEIFAASISFAVEWGHSETKESSCQAKGRSQVSLWETHRTAWVMGQSYTCYSCPGQGNGDCEENWKDAGWATVPGDGRKDTNLRNYFCKSAESAFCQN